MVLLDYGFCGCGVCSALVPQVCVWCLVLVGFFDSGDYFSGFDSGLCCAVVGVAGVIAVGFL